MHGPDVREFQCPDVWEVPCLLRRRYALHVTLPWTVAVTMLCRSVAADRCLAAIGTAPSCMLSVAPYAMQTCAASVGSVDCFRTRNGGPTTTALLISMLYHQHAHVKAPTCEGAGTDWLAATLEVTFVSCVAETRDRSPLLLAYASGAGHAATHAESRKTSAFSDERRTYASYSG
jgi:hypothetical protein